MKDYLNMIVKNPNQVGSSSQASSVHSTINAQSNKQGNQSQFNHIYQNKQNSSQFMMENDVQLSNSSCLNKDYGKGLST